MHRLSDEAESILEIVRDADDPTDRDRRRLKRAMAAQLGAAAVVSSATMGAAASKAAIGTAIAGGAGSAVTGAGLLTKVLASVALVAAVGGGVALHASRSPSRSVRVESEAPVGIMPRPRPSSPVATPIAENAAEPIVAPPDPPDSATAAVAPHAKPRIDVSRPNRRLEAPLSVEAPPNRNMLAREVWVLGSARSALRDHEPARALALLDENREVFAHGMLREEFLAARVLALRDLGRAADADAAAAQFAAENPHSPLAAQLAGSEPVRASDPHHR